MTAALNDVLQTLRAHESELWLLGVSHAAVFGSLARGEASADSDIDVLNWCRGGRPLKAVASGSRTLTCRGGLRDQRSASYTYPNKIHASLVGRQLAPAWYRDVHERVVGTEGVVETAREHWRHHRSRANVLEERQPREVTREEMTA
jgi:hypothetical protein